MSRLAASDRTALIHLASGLPKGSAERRAILENLRRAGRDKQVTVTFTLPPELFNAEDVEGELLDLVEDWMSAMKMKHREYPEISTVMEDYHKTVKMSVR